MFTRDDLLKLAGKTDRDDVVKAVSEIQDKDLRDALVMTVIMMNRNIEMENAVWRQKNDECNQLQAELEKAHDELHKLKDQLEQEK